MDKSDSYLFIKRPKLAIVISLVILLLGIVMMISLPLEEYPSITPVQVVVTATYTGASSDVIESTIAAPVESQLNGVDNMIYMTSSAQNGSYKLTLYFAVGTDPDIAVVNVQNELQLVIPRLPEEVRRYGLSVKKTTGGPGLLMISVNSPNHTYDNLFISNYADIFIKDELARIKGVGEVGVFGSSSYSMRIWLDAEKMVNYGLSAQDVIYAIQSQNIQTAAGELGAEPTNNKKVIKLTMRTKGRLKDPKEFENIIIKSNIAGAQIKLKDVAKVELGAENYSFFSRINGQNSAIITVSQLPNANAISLSNKIQKKLEELSKNFPKDIEYKIQHDETEFVRESIKEVISAIIIAVLLVSLVTYLFLGSMRAAFVPFCAIPVSLIGVFIFMHLLDFSINLLILFALVLAVGLVVDDAIVVLENTQRHIQQGKNVKEAVEITIKEVFGAVVATSLVLIAVFVPVSFMGGITGRMFRQFALCISSSIALSTLVALTLSPALCSIILKQKEEKQPKFIKIFNRWFNKIREKYITQTDILIKSHKSTLIILGFIVLISILSFYLIPGGFLPTEDRGAIFTQIQLPEGSSASRTDKSARYIESELKKIPGIKDTITLVGMNGENTAFIVSIFEPWHKRKNKKEQAKEIIKTINQKFSNYQGATIATFTPPAISGLGMFGGFEYQLLDKGERSTSEFFKLANELMTQARQSSKLSTIYTSFSANLPQLMIEVDIDKAMASGVNILEIYETISAYFAKTYVNDFNKYGRVYRVYVEADSQFRGAETDLSKVYVKNINGGMIPLSSLIKVTNIVGPYVRTRYNMYPAITINGSAASGVSSGEAMKEMEKISKNLLPKDSGFEWSGTSLQEKQSGGQILPILALSLTFVYLFLVGLYESWFLPLSVLLITPVALCGALLFQYISGYSLDIYCQIGLVMLIGLSAKQSILIVEFAKDSHKSGLGIFEAAKEAANLRFRAVMMTNISFLLGIIPLITASGAGAASRHSVGMTVFGGMLFASFAGSFLIPGFYTMIEDFKSKLSTYVNRRSNA